MKPGYAKKKAKAKAKKQQKKVGEGAPPSTAQQQDGDEMMEDANEESNKGVDNQGKEVDYEMHDADDKPHGSHKSKLEARRALKVKVQQLKNTRNKATKIPHAKGQTTKKETNANIRQLIAEQQGLGKGNEGKEKKKK